MDRPESGNANPAKKYINFKGNNGEFVYYDKEKEEDVVIPLPVRFAVLEEFHTVGGWDDSDGEDGSRIYANEILFAAKEELTVRNGSGQILAKGLYKDIKAEVKEKGGVYYKHIYAILDGEIVRIQIKGTAIKQWGDFTKKAFKRLKDEWVTVKKVGSGKKGSIKYKFPEFEFDKSFSDEEFEAFKEPVEEMMAFLNKDGQASPEAAAIDEAVANGDIDPDEVDLDDLGF